LTAVYRFEGEASHLGADSSGHGHDLVASGDLPPVQVHDHREGSASAQLRAGTSFFSATDQDPLPPVQQAGLTVGGWFLVQGDPMSGQILVSRDRPEDPIANGDLILQNPSPGSLVCTAQLPVDAGMVRDDLAPDIRGSWAHLVCRFDQNSGAIFMNGSELSTVPMPGTGPAAERPSPFTLGCKDPNCYVGNIDELFYQEGPMSELQVRRIWACGVDGKLCVCSKDDPKSYAECGRANGECDPFQLGDCNAPPP
jgi:hypothetical protein